MLNLFLILIGIILSGIGLFFIILYLNLLVIGYSFFEFVYFIIRSIYCDLFFKMSGFSHLIFKLKCPKISSRKGGDMYDRNY